MQVELRKEQSKPEIRKKLTIKHASMISYDVSSFFAIS